MLLHFASKPVPRALLGAGVAFRALFAEPLSTQSAPKIIKTTYRKSMCLAFCSMLLNVLSKLVPRTILEAVVACWALFFEPFWNVGLPQRSSRAAQQPQGNFPKQPQSNPEQPQGPRATPDPRPQGRPRPKTDGPHLRGRRHGRSHLNNKSTITPAGGVAPL